MIVDDHPILRDGLAALIRQSSAETHVVAAKSAEEALELLGEEPAPDVVILDLVMPGMDGLQALGEIRRRRPEIPVIVLSSSEDPQDVRRTLAHGAFGYVPKSATQNTLIAAINLVMDGEVYVPPMILGANGHHGGELDATPAEPSPAPLTERQIEVLALLCEGHSNKVIATKLDLAEKTVKVHVTSIFRALNVINRTQAAKVWNSRLS